MPITYAETQNAFVLYVNDEELTEELHFDLDQAFSRAFKKDYKHVVIDVTGAQTMNSMFISILMNTYIQLRELGGDMSMAGLTPNLDRLLRVVRLHTVFGIYDSVDEALAKIAAREMTLSAPLPGGALRPQQATG